LVKLQKVEQIYMALAPHANQRQRGFIARRNMIFPTQYDPGYNGERGPGSNSTEEPASRNPVVAFA